MDCSAFYLISSAALGFTIMFLFLLLWCMSLGFDWRVALLTWVAGLRDTVDLPMAMVVHFTARGGHPLCTTRQRFMFHKRGACTFTAFVSALLSTPHFGPHRKRQSNCHSFGVCSCSWCVRVFSQWEQFESQLRTAGPSAGR